MLRRKLHILHRANVGSCARFAMRRNRGKLVRRVEQIVGTLAPKQIGSVTVLHEFVSWRVGVSMVQFDEQARGPVGMLGVSGEIDMASADEFRDRLLDCLQRSESVEVDLGGVTFIDSSGLAALVRLRTEAEILGKDVALVSVSASTARLLELTGLQTLFDVELPQS